MGIDAVFLDRDGVINRDIGYVGRWEDFEFIPGAVAAMRSLASAGCRLVIVTNQSGIARGYYSEHDYLVLEKHMRTTLACSGVLLSGCYYCPHHPAGTSARYARECDCRKPKPGMIVRAANELGIRLAESILIGDKWSDMEAAQSARVGYRFLVNAKDPLDMPGYVSVDGIFDSLAQCVRLALGLAVDEGPKQGTER